MQLPFVLTITEETKTTTYSIINNKLLHSYVRFIFIAEQPNYPSPLRILVLGIGALLLPTKYDEGWHVLVLSLVSQQTARQTKRASLGWLRVVAHAKGG